MRVLPDIEVRLSTRFRPIGCPGLVRRSREFVHRLTGNGRSQ